MTTDPKDAEIARLKAAFELVSNHRDKYAKEIARLRDRLTEEMKLYAKTAAERDRWKKQSGDWQVRGWELGQECDRLTAERDAALALVQTAYKAGYYQAECGLPDHSNINTAAAAALSRRDAQMRAEAVAALAAHQKRRAVP